VTLISIKRTSLDEKVRSYELIGDLLIYSISEGLIKVTREMRSPFRAASSIRFIATIAHRRIQRMRLCLLLIFTESRYVNNLFADTTTISRRRDAWSVSQNAISSISSSNHSMQRNKHFGILVKSITIMILSASLTNSLPITIFNFILSSAKLLCRASRDNASIASRNNQG